MGKMIVYKITWRWKGEAGVHELHCAAPNAEYASVWYKNHVADWPGRHRVELQEVIPVCTLNGWVNSAYE